MPEEAGGYLGGWQPIRYEQRCRDRRALLDAALARAVEAASARAEVVRVLVFGS